MTGAETVAVAKAKVAVDYDNQVTFAGELEELVEGEGTLKGET